MLTFIFSPQPFDAREILIWDERKPIDTLYADNSGFCANVVVEVHMSLLEIWPHANT